MKSSEQNKNKIPILDQVREKISGNPKPPVRRNEKLRAGIRAICSVMFIQKQAREDTPTKWVSRESPRALPPLVMRNATE